jgi:hypothetical protein
MTPSPTSPKERPTRRSCRPLEKPTATSQATSRNNDSLSKLPQHLPESPPSPALAATAVRANVSQPQRNRPAFPVPSLRGRPPGKSQGSNKTAPGLLSSAPGRSVRTDQGRNETGLPAPFSDQHSRDKLVSRPRKAHRTCCGQQTKNICFSEIIPSYFLRDATLGEQDRQPRSPGAAQRLRIPPGSHASGSIAGTIFFTGKIPWEGYSGFVWFFAHPYICAKQSCFLQCEV